MDDFDDIREKVMNWILATGGLVLGILVLVILFPITLHFMFSFGYASSTARWPLLKDAALFTPLALLVAGFWILIKRWWNHGHSGF
jgi:hypothetical protein